MTRRSSLAFVALSFLAVNASTALGAPATTEPADDKSEGRVRFDLGEQHFQHGEFVAALVEYEAGYRLTRLPGFLLNIAQCHRQLGDLRKARAFYRKYLIVAPTAPRRAEVEESIRSLDKKIAEEAPGEAAEPQDEARKPRTPSVRWWLWSAVAASVVGSTVANMALAASEERASSAAH